MAASITFNKTASSSKREFKGKSLVALTDNYIALDIETTGLNPCCNEIIEIGAVKYSDGKITDEFETLVKPNNKISRFITGLTGITNDMADGAPKIDAVLPKLRGFLTDSIIVGHNVNFDINFLYENFSCFCDYRFSNDFIDTMRLSRKLFKDLPNHKLATLVCAFNIPKTVAHRALSDAVYALKCYEYMKNYMRENNIML